MDNTQIDHTAPKKPPLSDIEQATGEPPAAILDLDRWTLGEDYPAMMARLLDEIDQAVYDETDNLKRIRSIVFPSIANHVGISHAGLDRVDVSDIERTHHGLLFNGGVEACDGTTMTHDTLPITITQIGVCLTSYHGQQGSYVHRIYRRDLRDQSGDPVDQALELLRRRGKREAVGVNSERDTYSTLFSRGIMAHAERALLLDRSDAVWRMGHGNPLPYELMTGHWAHDPFFVDAALGLMRRLVEYERFVFVPSAPSRELMTLGQALRPREYLILYSLEARLRNMLDRGGYRGEARRKVTQFVEDIGPQVVVGVYRASRMAPPNIFYAHRDHAQMAAFIAIADSVLQMHRGFPMLIDIADQLCSSAFGADPFVASVQQAYSQTGEPFRFLSERETRR